MASVAGSAGLAERFHTRQQRRGDAMTYSVARRDYISHNIRCNCISPPECIRHFVDGYLKNNYPAASRRCSRN